MTTDSAPALPGFAPERVARDNVAHPVPPVGVYMSPDHRYWLNGEGPVPSVTTVLGILDKPAVVAWKSRESARAMWRALNPRTGVLPDLEVKEGTDAEELQRTEDALIKWAMQEADKTRDTAAALGTQVHRLADIVGAPEAGSMGFQVSEETLPYVEAFRGFLDRYGGSQSIVSSEHCVWSANGYAGTYDLLMQLPATAEGHSPHTDPDACTICLTAGQELWLIDIKTSKGYYPEYGLQLAGYRWADSIVLPDTPVVYPMPHIQRTGVLHLRPDQYPDTGWRLIEYPTLYEKDYMTFLGALEIWRWKEEKRFTKSNLQKHRTP